jgi:hypothetical protein
MSGVCIVGVGESELSRSLARSTQQLIGDAYVLGIAHVVELVRQLRHEAANQVTGAEIAAYGGYTGADAATLVLGRL